MEENKNQIPEQETTPVVEAKKSFIQKLGKKKLIAIISAIVAVAILIPVIILIPKDKTEAQAPDAFVIMTEQLDGLFNPFFATSGNDSTIVAMRKNLFKYI